MSGVPEHRSREYDRGQAAGRQPRRRGVAGRGRRLPPYDQPTQPGLLLRRVATRRRPRRLRRRLLVVWALGARLAGLRLVRLLFCLVRVLLRGGRVPAERRRPCRAAARYPTAPAGRPQDPCLRAAHPRGGGVWAAQKRSTLAGVRWPRRLL